MTSPPNSSKPVSNAGLVILNSYIQLLFDRLSVTHGNTFTGREAQSDAVFYLQYLATGTTAADDMLLPLNKLLCGLPLSCPLPLGPTLSESQRELMDGLLKAVIGNWPLIGESTADGFRGNWLIRDGILTEQEQRWELVVEKRAYDVLLGRSPFEFSIIKYPWMPKPLHVTWPY